MARLRLRATLPGLAAACLAACQPTPPAPAPPAPALDQPAGPGTPDPAFTGEVAPGAARHDVTGRYGGTLSLPSVSNPKSFNPVLASETSTTDIVHGVMFRPLIFFNRERSESVPDLLESWSHSEDFRTWTFRLRAGLAWSDGRPITAADALFTYQVIVDDKVLSAIKSGLVDPEAGAPRAERVDDLTFRLVAARPNVHLWLYAGEIYLLPEHVLGPIYRDGKFSSDAYSVSTPPDRIVVSGPYRLKEFKPDERVVLERNPWFSAIDRDGNRLPYLDRVVFLVTPNTDTSLLKFMNGEVDALEPFVYPKDYQRLKDGEKAGGYTVTSAGLAYNSNFWWVNQNPGKSPGGKPYVDPHKLKWFRNRKFRQALSHATDRAGMVQTIYLGLGEPLWGHPTPANVQWYNPDIPRYPYDLDRARALLDELGFKDRDGDGLREDGDGRPFSFTINTNSSNTDRVRIASILVDDLGKIGLKATSEPLDFNALVEKFRSTYDYEAAILGLSSAVPPHPILGKNVYLSSGMTHYWHPNQKGKPGYEWEARVDQLMTEMDRTEEVAEQKRLFFEVQRIMAEEAVWSTLIVQNYYIAAKDRVRNLKPSALRPSTFHNIEELWVQ